MLHVVLDTNVVLSGVRSRRGASHSLLDELDDDQFVLDLSVPLVLEYEDVVLRWRGRINQEIDDVPRFIDSLCDRANQYEIFFLWRPGLVDPKDEHLLELAVRARSDAIVTYNVRHFRGAAAYGIPVLTPLQFLRLLENQDDPR